MTHRWISKLACHTTAPSLYGEATPAIQAQIGTAGALFRTATRRHGDCGGTLCVPTPALRRGATRLPPHRAATLHRVACATRAASACRFVRSTLLSPSMSCVFERCSSFQNSSEDVMAPFQGSRFRAPQTSKYPRQRGYRCHCRRDALRTLGRLSTAPHIVRFATPISSHAVTVRDVRCPCPR